MSEVHSFHWDFPASNYADIRGFDSPDMETFKKDPIASLARESVQNSIDAKRPGIDGPVRIEFVSFEANVSDIVGIEEIRAQLVRCEQKQQGSDKDLKRIQRMVEVLNREKIKILRISDHNTTGLTDLVSGNPNGRWASLIKGSGSSRKTEGSLGSKGIGKFASFVCSSLQMVFYSTYNEEEDRGYEGVCRLCSATIKDSNDYTQGPGYYSNGSEHNAIIGDIPVGWSFARSNGDYGTDVYIIGFQPECGWAKEVISNILESYIVAIHHGELTVRVEDTEISSSTLGKIVNDAQLIVDKTILGQYDCLVESDSLLVKNLDLEDFPEQLELRVKKYLPQSEEEKRATRKCAMIRWPFMRVKEVNSKSLLPCSSMLLIRKGELGDMLREIENPQHDNWEPKRIEDLKRRKYVQEILKKIDFLIAKTTRDFLQESNASETDFEGAGEFLPDIAAAGGNKKKLKDEMDAPSLGREKQSVLTNSSGYEPSVESEVIVPDIGAINEEEEGEASLPSGHNAGDGGEPRPGDTDGLVVPGDKEVFKRVKLAFLHYRFFCLDKKKGKYCIYVVAPTDDTNCRMEIFVCDDAEGKEKPNIISCVLEGSPLPFVDNQIYGFSFKKDRAYRFLVDLDMSEYFSGRIEFYADRK